MTASLKFIDATPPLRSSPLRSSSLDSGIVATGSALPTRSVSNSELEKYLDTSDAWIRERVGIGARHICNENETCVSLAKEASKQALSQAGLEPGSIDILVFATVTADQLLQSAAALLANELGIDNAMAFDVTAACSGFLFAMATADSLLSSFGKGNALVIGAETLSRVVDWKDRNTAVLFGDGAGAAILQRNATDDSPILASYLKTDASAARFIERKSGGFPELSEPACSPAACNKDSSPYINMAGREVFRAGVRHMSTSIKEVLAQANVTAEDIKLFFPHQSNARMIQSVANNIGLTEEQVALNIETVGNTSAASVPIALDEYARKGALERGDLVLLTAVGSGMTYGSILLRW